MPCDLLRVRPALLGQRAVHSRNRIGPVLTARHPARAHYARTRDPARIRAPISRYGPNMKFLKPRVREDVVLRFIANNFDAGTAVLATDDRFEKFISLVRDRKDVLAAQEYKRLTDSSLAECLLATKFARGLT